MSVPAGRGCAWCCAPATRWTSRRWPACDAHAAIDADLDRRIAATRAAVDAAQAECTTAESQEFAAVIREAFLEVATGAWKAHAIGMHEDKMLVLLADTMEPLVQSIVRRATR